MVLLKPVTVAETDVFVRQAERLLSLEESDALKVYLSMRPRDGDVVPGTGGARKLRWRAKGKGKRGGVQVIYFFHHPDTPLVLLLIYAKGEKADLSARERNGLKSLIQEMIGSR